MYVYEIYGPDKKKITEEKAYHSIGPFSFRSQMFKLKTKKKKKNLYLVIFEAKIVIIKSNSENNVFFCRTRYKYQGSFKHF